MTKFNYFIKQNLEQIEAHDPLNYQPNAGFCFDISRSHKVKNSGYVIPTISEKGDWIYFVSWNPVDKLYKALKADPSYQETYDFPAQVTVPTRGVITGNYLSIVDYKAESGVACFDLNNLSNPTYMPGNIFTPYIRAIAADGEYLWACAQTNPPLLYKFKPPDFTPILMSALNTSALQPYAMAIDDTHIYISTGENPANIIKVNKSNITDITTQSLPVGYQIASVIAVNDTYVFTAVSGAPSKLVRMPKTDLSTQSTGYFPSGSYSPTHMIADNRYFWTCFDSDPGTFVRSWCTNLSFHNQLTAETGISGIKEIAFDGTFFWLAALSAESKILQVCK